MLHPPIIDIVPNSSALAERAAQEFVGLAKKELQSKSRFTVALAGGSTPQQMYVRLREATLSWDHIDFFWGDERCLPLNDKDSNFHMVNEALLKFIPIPIENIHRILGEIPGEKAAKNYEDDLRRFFGRAAPRFSLIILGLGSDGHTASLFPGSSAIREKSRWAVSVNHRVSPPPLVDRVTLTLPVLNAAAHVLFLVSGSEKAKLLSQVLHGQFKPDLFPAQAVKPVDGTLHWLVDQDAAAKLPIQQLQ
jgi:6-phosphogluconolactonase